MRRLQFAMIALVATAVGASVCAVPSMAKPPMKKSSAKKSSMKKKVSAKKSSTRRRTDRKGCPPRRPRPPRGPRTQGIPPRPPVENPRTINVKATIDQETLDKLKQDIIDAIKIPEPAAAKDVDLSAITARLDAQQKMIQMLIECCELYKKDRTFDLRKTAHFEEQLCDILTIVKQQQECLDKLCKGMGGGMAAGSGAGMGTGMTTRKVMGPVEMKPAKISLSRDVSNGDEAGAQLGYDLGKFPILGGSNSVLQVYADHFETAVPISGAGLAGRFYTGKTGKLNLYGGAGVGAYTTNFTRGGTHQTENGGKVFVGLETNRRTFVEFNVTSIQNYGSNSNRSNVYFGQRF
jgi:hypothetical protein